MIQGEIKTKCDINKVKFKLFPGIEIVRTRILSFR